MDSWYYVPQAMKNRKVEEGRGSSVLQEMLGSLWTVLVSGKTS